MKLLIQKTNEVKGNIKKIELTSSDFENNTNTYVIKENESPIIYLTDTQSSYFIDDIDSKLERVNSETVAIITMDDLISLGGGTAPAGIESITGGLVDNTDTSNPVIVDAPSDGTQYARKDGTWEAVPEGSAGKQFKALIGVASSEEITVYIPLVNSIGLITPVWTRLAPGMHMLTFANTADVFTGTLFAHVGGNIRTNDSRIITTYKMGNTFYINCVSVVDGSYIDLNPGDKYSLFFESL